MKTMEFWQFDRPGIRNSVAGVTELANFGFYATI
jgi:hypothetical protein